VVVTAPRVRRDVRAALEAARPVVALESTLIAHGLERPANLEVARELEALVVAGGAVPATVAVVGGVATVGLEPAELARIAAGDGVAKLGVRDLAPAAAARADGATTVASTAHLAALAGIRVFATGGLGGVHREAWDTWDESADLWALARTGVCVVCSGVKSILDVGASLERLESLGVTVLGYRARSFHGFYLTDSGHPVDWPIATATASSSSRSGGSPAPAPSAYPPAGPGTVQSTGWPESVR
jgi:pseudouridine-5'-phosphate glycosidase